MPGTLRRCRAVATRFHPDSEPGRAVNLATRSRTSSAIVPDTFGQASLEIPVQPFRHVTARVVPLDSGYYGEDSAGGAGVTAGWQMGHQNVTLAPGVCFCIRIGVPQTRQGSP